MNRIIIDDISIKDRKGNHMIDASRFSLKMNPFTLLTDNAAISSSQLFGADLHIKRDSASAEPNCQFLIDLLSSDNDKKEKQSLSINSFVIRRGTVSYDVNNAPEVSDRLDPNHLTIKNISGHLVINKDADNNTYIKLKKLSFKEKSGLDVRRLSFRLNNTDKETTIDNFILNLANTSLNFKEAKASYETKDGKLIQSSIRFTALTDSTSLVLSDLSPIVPLLKNFNKPLFINTKLKGTLSSADIERLTIHSLDRSIDISGNGSVYDFKKPRWKASVERLVVNEGTIAALKENFGKNDNKQIEILSRLGDVNIKGNAEGYDEDLIIDGSIESDAGTAILELSKKSGYVQGTANTDKLDLGVVSGIKDLGTVTADVDFRGNVTTTYAISNIIAKGLISEIYYKNHNYQEIAIDGSYKDHVIEGKITIDDPDAYVNLQGSFTNTHSGSSAKFNASIEHLRPYALGLTNKWKDADFNMNISADIKGRTADTASGTLDVSDFIMNTSAETLYIDMFSLSASNNDSLRSVSLRSDFADADITGKYNYTTLQNSLSKILERCLPSYAESKTYADVNNSFALNMRIKDANWLRMICGLPVSIDSPMTLKADVSDDTKITKLCCNIPNVIYNDAQYNDGLINIKSDSTELNLCASFAKIMGNGHKMDFSVSSDLKDDRLYSDVCWNNNNENEFSGCLSSVTKFIGVTDGKKQTQINVNPSEMVIGGVKWFVRPSTIIFGKNDIEINNFIAENENQHLIVNGRATDKDNDSIIVNMRDMEVAYILDLVNFHSVKFSGRASGTATVSSVFNKPKASSDLIVDDFRFQGGRMGCLHANVKWNDIDEQIDIDALADDLPTGTTRIYGYVSPKRDYLWLNLGCNKMRAEFLEGFCGSFMHNVTATIIGDAVVGGPLSRVNLMGDLKLTGNLGISSIGTDYYLDNVNVHCEPDLLRIHNGAMSDATGGKGLLNGVLHHKSFTRLNFDVSVDSKGLPMYQTTDKNGDTFYGTIYMDGNCRVHGRIKDVMIDIDALPVKESFMVYDASAPDAINDRNFITWKTAQDSTENQYQREELYNATDIHMNMNIDATSALKLKVLMDKESGDNIVLQGEGALRATYYNKGPFNMFGTYNVRQGNYRLTIQNILEKNFAIQNGSRIVFSGDPYAANLNLNATHTVNGVSLSDLKIGKSFSNNTIRVNCIMGIKGTPEQPRVDFDIDLPTVDSEVQQMIRSMITTEEDMNRQVVYILGIGRFYVPEDANVDTETGPSQTSLAMQSLLSGTISSQINSLIGRIVNSKQWNFGANISTGDEGWNNAEYEGIISGHMLNNRLLVNGQFGYRDNANATTGFIGDFDIRYLLYPSGNFALRLYNQTNDRYFTKSSLTTQGVGLILKKDFWGFKDLFGSKHSRDKKSYDKPTIQVIREPEPQQENNEDNNNKNK